MNIAIYTLTSPLHDEMAVNAVSKDFIRSIEDALGQDVDFRGPDFDGFGTHDLDVIYVRTGGTESLFKEVLPDINGNVYLLTSGKSNSLAASMEILSYLNQQGRKGEIIHGTPEYIASRMTILSKVSKAGKVLNGQNLGIIGQPSDWLISSAADPLRVKDKLGVNLVNIDIQELVSEIKTTGQNVVLAPSVINNLNNAPQSQQKYVGGAVSIYGALKKIISRYELSGLTLRCFDLLTAVGNTGCLALALLNAEGIPAGCEGDVPALLTMSVGNALTGMCGFQANPSRIDPQTGEILLAHCTVPFNMVRKYSFNTHFESGIGIAVHGELPEGKATIFKLSGDLSRSYFQSAELIENQYGQDLCRTQISMKLSGSTDYFLTDPIGNHHIVFTGDHKALFDAFVKSIA